jgi:hypothetical protein
MCSAAPRATLPLCPSAAAHAPHRRHAMEHKEAELDDVDDD